MVFLLATSLWAAFCMPTILSCYHVAIPVCKKMVNMCCVHWDIKFNPTKSQRISFGTGHQPPSPFTVMLNDTVIKWVDKVKYLGCYFNQTCKPMCGSTTQKYYGNFNSILTTLGCNRNELTAVHLVKSYCIPSLLYGCEN